MDATGHGASGSRSDASATGRDASATDRGASATDRGASATDRGATAIRHDGAATWREASDFVGRVSAIRLVSMATERALGATGDEMGANTDRCMFTRSNSL